MNRLEKTDALLIIAFLSLVLFPLLYVLRHLDDNTLTSWRWAFSDGNMGRVFLLVLSGTAFSFLIVKSSFPERRAALFLFLFSWLAVAPLWGEPEAILDASRYFLQAKHLELYGIQYFFREWGGEIAAWTDLPVVPFFYGLIFRYFGEARIYIQVFTTLLFSLTVVLTCLIGRALWDRETGFLAGLLLLGIPYLLIQAPLMLVDVPLMFLLTLSLYTFLSALEKGGILRIAGASGIIVLTLFSKYSAWPMLLVLPVVTVVLTKKGPSPAGRRSIQVFAPAAIMSGLAFFAYHDVFLHQLALLREYQWPGLGRWRESFVSTFFFQVHPAVTLSALFAVVPAIRKRDLRFLIPAAFALFALAFRVERIRYLLPLFPLFTLMAASGLNGIRDWEIRKFIAWCAVAASLAVALGAYLPFLNRTSMANLRDAGGYLDSLPGNAAEIRILPQKRSAGNTEAVVPLLDLYTGKKLIYRGEYLSPPAAEQVQKSPLRFSWELGQPRFYRDVTDPGPLPIAVISSVPLKGGGFSIRTFTSDSGTFRYRIFVTVFGLGHLAKTAHEFATPWPVRDRSAASGSENPHFLK